MVPRLFWMAEDGPTLESVAQAKAAMLAERAEAEQKAGIRIIDEGDRTRTEQKKGRR